MINCINSRDSSVNEESKKELLKTLDLMAKIEEAAQARLKEILADIEAGKITLDEVKRQRRLI